MYKTKANKGKLNNANITAIINIAIINPLIIEINNEINPSINETTDKPKNAVI